MVNIILEEMKRQWEKGYIKVLLIVILLISILTGCFQVIKVKESYNNIIGIARITENINYKILENDIKEYKEYKQGLIEKNAINRYLYIMATTILVLVGIYTVVIALYDVKNKEITKKMKKYGHLKIHISKIFSVIIVMIASIIIGIICYLITIEILKNTYNIMGHNLNIIGITERSAESMVYNVDYIKQFICLVGINSLYVYIIYTFCLLIPYDIIMYILTFIFLGGVRKLFRTNYDNAIIYTYKKYK